MDVHPIEGLMKTAMESIRDMVDVNTILGDPVETPDGNVIIPISRVTFGFAAGGTEYEPAPGGQGGDSGRGDGGGGQDRSGDQDGGGGQGKGQSADANRKELPFGGGSGAGISIQPVAFLVVGQQQIRLLPVDGGALYDRLLDMAPRLVEQVQGMLRRDGQTGGQPSQAQGGSGTQQNQQGMGAGIGGGMSGHSGFTPSSASTSSPPPPRRFRRLEQ